MKPTCSFAYLLAFICCLCFSPVLRAAVPPGQVAVSPTKVELKIGPNPVYQSIRLKNMKPYPVTIKVEVNNWTLDENNNLKSIPPDEQSLDRWMVINPLNFTVEPGGIQVVRFSIIPRNRPAPGEHRAIVYFIEQPSNGEDRPFDMLFRLGVGVYGNVDPIRRSAELKGLVFERSSRTLKADIENGGNVHARFIGDYAVWKTGSFAGFGAMKAYLEDPEEVKKPEGLVAYGKMNPTPVLDGRRRTISTGIGVLPSGGDYTVTVQGSIDGRTIEKVLR